MNQSAQRRVGVAALAMAILLTAGCAPGNPAASGKSTSPAAGEPTPTATPTPTADAGPPSNLTFDGEEFLDPSQWSVGWSSLSEDDGFPVLAADDGNGSWSHTDSATGCQLYFYQGEISDMVASQGDRALTDSFLATVLGQTGSSTPADDVAQYAYDDPAPTSVVGLSDATGSVDMRTIWWDGSDGKSQLLTARMFGQFGGGVFLSITCPAGHTASNERDRLFGGPLSVAVQPV